MNPAQPNQIPQRIAKQPRWSTNRNLLSGVERLGHRDESDAMGVKQLHQLGEVDERPGQAIDFVDDHNVDSALPDVREQLLQPGRSRLPPEKPPSS